MLKAVKKTLIVALTILLLVCFGFAAVSITAVNAESKNLKITNVTGAMQENLSRYLVYFSGETPLESGSTGRVCFADITVNGKTESADVWNAGDGRFFFPVSYEIAPKDAKNEIVIKTGTVIGDYVVSEDVTIAIEGENIFEKIPEDNLDITEVGGFAQDGLSRYIVSVIFDKEISGTENEHFGDWTITVNGKEVVTGVYYYASLKGVFFPVNYSDAPKETKNEITIKAGSKFKNYTVKSDFNIVAENGEIRLPVIETPEEKTVISSIEGYAQDIEAENLHRYLIYLNFDKAFESTEGYVGQITVSVNGKDVIVEAYNDVNGKRVFICVNFTDAPKNEANEITIKEGTKFAHFVLSEEITLKTKGEKVEIKVSFTDISLAWRKNKEGVLEGGAQDNLSRYIFYIKTDCDGLGDTMWEGNECVIDEGTDGENIARIYFLGGVAKPNEEGYDPTSILAIIQYGDITEGATFSSDIGKHSITIKAGSELGGGYLVSGDLTIWVCGAGFAEKEEDLPSQPDGIQTLIKGIENKTIEYTAQNIEDYIGAASVVKLKGGSEKLADGNVLLKNGSDELGYCKSIKIVGKQAEPKIKFRSVYGGGDIYLALELRSETDNGNYWIQQGAPIARLRYCGSRTAETQLAECLWFDFFKDGLQGAPLVAGFTNTEFTLTEGEFFVEFGAVNKTDALGRAGFVFFVSIIQGGNVGYAECFMSGENNVSEAGDVAIYQAPYTTARIDPEASAITTYDVKDFTIMSVDSERTVEGQKVNIGAMSFYSPQLRRAENYDVYDISDIVPIGNGKTYTKKEGDTTSSSQSMINAVGVSAKNGGYSVKMKITFTGDDFGCTFAFRGKNTNAASGYVMHIAEDVVIIGSMTKASPFKTGETYEIEVGCIDYFTAEEKVASGVFVFLKVNGELIIEDSIDKKVGLGDYFCGLIEGAGGSSATVAAAVNSSKQPVIVTKSNKTVVANGKKTTLSYESDMPTAFDEISYEVVKGKARIEKDGLYSETDGEIVVRAKITNEYGTFYGSEITINAGQKESGCKGSVDGSLCVLPVIALAAFVLIMKKRREN